METASDIKKAFDYLKSQEGTTKYLMEKTLLPREKVERIRQLGEPWPERRPEGWEHQQACVDALFHGVPYPEGTDPIVALEALNQLRELDLEEMEGKLAAYEAAVERGETPEPLPELKGASELHDHLEEVAKLSGESIESIGDIYFAELTRQLRMIQWVQKWNELRVKEENDQKGG